MMTRKAQKELIGKLKCLIWSRASKKALKAYWTARRIEILRKESLTHEMELRLFGTATLNLDELFERIDKSK